MSDKFECHITNLWRWRKEKEITLDLKWVATHGRVHHRHFLWSDSNTGSNMYTQDQLWKWILIAGAHQAGHISSWLRPCVMELVSDAAASALNLRVKRCYFFYSCIVQTWAVLWHTDASTGKELISHARPSPHVLFTCSTGKMSGSKWEWTGSFCGFVTADSPKFPFMLYSAVVLSTFRLKEKVRVKGQNVSYPV